MRRFLTLISLLFLAVSTTAQSIVALCPNAGIPLRPTNFSPSGIILTYFDGASLWVYDIARNTRYPLPETVPCVGNCRLSPDALWITYLNPQTSGYMKMRLNGLERTAVMDSAADILWGNNNSWLVWTPDHRAFLQADGATRDARVYLPTEGVIAMQADGKWAIQLGETQDGFMRYLIHEEALQTGQMTTPTPLTLDTPYFNASSFSPTGNYLAYVGRGAVDAKLGIAGAELFIAPLDDSPPRQLSDLTGAYGAVRIDGATPASLAWSPDGSKVAYWVTPLTSADVTATTASATIHITDVNSGQTTRYCDFTTTEHTPNPPHLVWSPDGSHLALGGNVEGDSKGYLLLTLDVASGQFIEMSDGIFPALGAPDVLAWGNVP